MEIFRAYEVADGICRLDNEESVHCIRVLRHRTGDEINVIDGFGTMFVCRLLSESVKSAEAEIISKFEHWGGHNYDLTMAVCPTKNIDRFEWFIEKATEMGVDRIVPVIGEHSERKVVRPDRLQKILLSAAKQSLKARLPELSETLSIRSFIDGTADSQDLKLIACCFEEEKFKRSTIKDILGAYKGRSIIVLIGPEGDFSRDEVLAAINAGYVPVTLGDTRLRTETAAMYSVAAVNYHYL